MKTKRFFSVAAFLCMSVGIFAQNALTEDGKRAQKALVEHLRASGVTPSIDTKDNSVCFKSNDVLYWVTFEGNSPVLYTIHRKGLKFDNDPAFKPSCARLACNEVNRKHKIKSMCNEKRVEFVMETYAKEPSDFHGGLRKMVAAFKDVDATFKNTYDKAFDQWKKDSIEQNKPIAPSKPVPGSSPLTISYVAFGNFEANGTVISDFDQPLRKNSCKYIKATIDVASSEKGIFKIGMKITSPDGKAMIATKGVDYCSTANVEIKKTNKKVECNLDPYGSDTPDFWKAGEYKVELYDFEKGVLLHSTTFNIL